MTRRPSPRPYKVIVTTDASQTLGHGKIRHYPTMLAAANAFVKAAEPFKTVIFDDGCQARELDEREHQQLRDVCELLGVELNDG